MVDLSIRKNDKCIVGHPQCGYVFNSQRSCFIAYGFATSPFEVDIISSILRDRNIEPIEAGSDVSPGTSVFCSKICSKILSARFCIIFANEDTIDGGVRAQNPNVNMEYGLSLGFQKYIIPFQKDDQQLPFNVSGIDTIKYNERNFRQKAENAVDIAIDVTSPKEEGGGAIDSNFHLFLYDDGYVFSPIESSDEKVIYELGAPFSFRLLLDHSGFLYRYAGQFSHCSVPDIQWRIDRLIAAIEGRGASIERRVNLGLVQPGLAKAAIEAFESISIVICVQSTEQKLELQDWVGERFPNRSIHFFSRAEIDEFASQIPFGR